MYWETEDCLKKNQHIWKCTQIIWCTFSVTVTVVIILQMVSFYSVSNKQHKTGGGAEQWQNQPNGSKAIIWHNIK